MVARGGAGDARARQRIDPDHRRNRGHPAVPQLGGVRSGEVRGPRSGAGDGAIFIHRGSMSDVNVDGGIDMPLPRKLIPNAKDEDLLKPSAIADACCFLAHQDRSAWTHELDVRPFGEKILGSIAAEKAGYLTAGLFVRGEFLHQRAPSSLEKQSRESGHHPDQGEEDEHCAGQFIEESSLRQSHALAGFGIVGPRSRTRNSLLSGFVSHLLAPPVFNDLVLQGRRSEMVNESVQGQ
jgi:hypothetical protein